MWENSQKCSKVKPINNTLKTQRIKLNSLTDFAKYIQRDHKHSKRKGNVLFNFRDVTYRMNSSELKTLFTSNHEEAKRKIVCCCSSFNKLCIRKAKDTDLTLFNFDELRIYMQTDKDSLVNVRKIYEKFGGTTCLLWPQFHAITGCDMVSYFFNVSKRILF